jgi:hypothetical protein
MSSFGDLFKWLRSKKKVKKKKKNNNKERVEKHKKRELLSSGILTDSNENASDYPINEQVEHFATYNDYVRIMGILSLSAIVIKSLTTSGVIGKTPV